MVSIAFRKEDIVLYKKGILCILMFVFLMSILAGCQQGGTISNTLTPEKTSNPQVQKSSEPTKKYTQSSTIKPAAKLVVIDAGHQAKGNSDTEPIGPGATEMKKKVSSGTRGTTTGIYEYELNLTVAHKLKKVLEGMGYLVIMTRTTNDVDISNSERAKMANTANADALIRIHANGSEKSSINGVLTICNTSKNPYNASIYQQCRKLADCVLSAVITSTNANSRGVWETDTMSGINWSKVPTTIVEMGYMTNPEEEKLLVNEEYEDKIVTGIANGLNQYFKEANN